MEIQNHISELLYYHDCVIIPELGAFLTNFIPVKINPVQHIFTPPSKNVVFNVNIKNNDGLLVYHVSKSQNISFNEANDLVRDFVKKCHEELKKNQRISFENIGVLYLNSEGSIQFDPENTINYLTDSFGLASFVSQPVKRENKTQRLDKKPADRALTKDVNENRIPKSIKWSTTIAVPVIALMMWGSVNTKVMKNVYLNYTNVVSSFINYTDNVSGHVVESFKSVTFFKNKILKTEKIIAPVKTKTEKNIKPVIINNKPAESASIKNSIESKEVSINSKVAGTEKKYLIIGGCFREMTNAEQFVKDTREKGFDSEITGTNAAGLHRVTLGIYNDQEKASHELQAIRSKGYSAWLLAD